ncbi:MAG: TonB-dependent receptor [Pseudomonadota bacterium]|nr:TonB-dependent receptor [Pseudomonadota bacterium]
MLITGALLGSRSVHAQSPEQPAVSRLDVLQISATRFADPVQEVPNSIAVITGEDLAARDVHELRAALAQLAGVTVGPGGDEGSAGYSLGLLGRRETDDFLLVVDGVPAGGAFTPQFATLDLHGVERIEVIRGTAPVYYGTTAFAGTIAVFHHAPGKAPLGASVGMGGRGSFDVAASASFGAGPVRQSLSADAENQAGSDPRAGYRRAHALYRAAAGVLGGEARLDLDLSDLHDRPASPTPFDRGQALLPTDFNQNPADAHIDTRRAKLTLGYDHALGLASWSSLLALTHSQSESVRGFLDPGYAAESVSNASGYQQARGIDDLFFDTHLTRRLLPGVDATIGVNILDGQLASHSRQFAYLVGFNGSPPLASGNWDTIDNTRLSDHRTFYGTYLQSRWKASDSLNVLAGLRWNRIVETRDGYGDAEGSDHQQSRSARLSGSLGVNWWLWKDASGDLDDLSVYANFGNTFQPPQVDFGPDAQIGPILKPEYLQSGEAGIKADGFDGRLDVAVSAFFVRFDNRPLNTTVNNLPAVVAGGQERFKGVELEGGYKLTPTLRLALDYSRSVASYGNFATTLNGLPTQLAGQRIEFVPDQLWGLGLVSSPSHGWQAALNAKHVGRRFLDPLNQYSADGFTLIDASVGYRWREWTARLSARNLGDRRDPVLASELGSGQAYRMDGRTVMASLAAALP